MSLESGRKLGFAASIITVIIPVIMIGLLFSFIFFLFTFVGLGRVNPNVGLFSIGLFASIAVLAIVAFIGYILFMIAMHQLSKYYSESSIFTNVLYALIMQIVGGVVVVGIFMAYFLFSIGSFVQTSTSPTSASVFPQFAVMYIVFFSVSIVFGVIGGVLYRRAFNKLSEKSGIDHFKTAGLLFLIGAVFSIIIWVAWIFAAMGFKRLTPPSTANTLNGFPITASTKRCAYCRTENSPDAVYCRNCGRQYT